MMSEFETGAQITSNSFSQKADTGITSAILPQDAAAAAGDGHEEDPGRLGLCSLGEVVLVCLFKMLRVSDRARLACTCSVMYAVMHNPSVWTNVTIHPEFYSTYVYFGREMVDFISAKDRAMIRKYGRYFKNVKVVLRCGWLTPETFRVLKEFDERKILKRLVLCYGKDLHYRRNYTMRIGALHMPCVADLLYTLSTVTRVKMQIIMYSYLHSVNQLVAFYTQEKPELCALLESLVISETQIPEWELAERINGSSAPTADLISSFPALQKLQLSINSFSDQLLQELSDTSRRRCPLRKLVLTHKHSRLLQTYPQLSSDAWKQLTLACPHLTVECCLMVNHLLRLSDVIKPETPLVKMKVVGTYRFDHKDVLELCRLCTEHCDTLERFELWVNTNTYSRSAQKGLKDMAMACANIRHFLCDYDIHYKLVIDMARDPRQWRTFKFRESRITTHKTLTRMLSALHIWTDLNMISELPLFAQNEVYDRERQQKLDKMHKVVKTELGFPM